MLENAQISTANAPIVTANASPRASVKADFAGAGGWAFYTTAAMPP